MRPFVLLQTRPEDIASEGEYKSFLELGKLSSQELIRIRMDQGKFWEIDFSKISGIILPGSPFNVSNKNRPAQQKRIEDEIFYLLKRIIKDDFPFFSICYGMGILGVYTNTKVTKKYAENLNVINIELTDIGQKDKLLKGVNRAFASPTGHKLALEEVPESAKLLATGEKCPIQMIRLKNNIYSTQFHPELNYQSLAVRMKVYKDHGYFLPQKMNKILATAKQHKYSDTNKIIQNFISLYRK
ncbi:MAG: glutamine amidotransferase [Bifidobacteriaceae bacterium]|jgi:GMP synthase (glutamine-hydrolysing)|nr:glutamine amidotransferase [Bifidobacteriaceae bacterium]